MTEELPSSEPSTFLTREALPPLAYESHTRHPLATAIRALGVAFLILATLALAMIPLWIFTTGRSLPRITQAGDRSLFITWFIIGTALSVAMAVLQITAGIAMMRLRVRSTRLARIWAWASLVCGALNVALNLYFQLHLKVRGYDFSMMAYVVGYFVEHWAMSATVPVFVLIFSRSPAFQEALSQ